jgi:hypothetical protein
MLQDIPMNERFMHQKNTNDERNDSGAISNEIMDHIDEWGENGMVSREIWKRAGELGLLHRYARNIWWRRIRFYIQCLHTEESLQKMRLRFGAPLSAPAASAQRRANVKWRCGWR